MPREQRVLEGVVYDPCLDCGCVNIRLDDGEHVTVDSQLREGERVRVTIEVLEEADDA